MDDIMTQLVNLADPQHTEKLAEIARDWERVFWSSYREMALHFKAPATEKELREGDAFVRVHGGPITIPEMRHAAFLHATMEVERRFFHPEGIHGPPLAHIAGVPYRVVALMSAHQHRTLLLESEDDAPR